MKIVLIRHGCTAANTQKVFSLDDEPLSKDAYPDIAVLKERLRAYPFEAVYASPLLRAVQTAEYLGLKHIRLDARIKEYDFGLFKGLSFLQFV